MPKNLVKEVHAFKVNEQLVKKCLLQLKIDKLKGIDSIHLLKEMAEQLCVPLNNYVYLSTTMCTSQQLCVPLNNYVYLSTTMCTSQHNLQLKTMESHYYLLYLQEILQKKPCKLHIGIRDINYLQDAGEINC